MEILDFALTLNHDFDTDTTLDRPALSLLQNAWVREDERSNETPQQNGMDYNALPGACSESNPDGM